MVHVQAVMFTRLSPGFPGSSFSSTFVLAVRADSGSVSFRTWGPVAQRIDIFKVLVEVCIKNLLLLEYELVARQVTL